MTVMGIKFRPMPWLTFLTLICLGILISLGSWQYKRLQWKTDLIVQIDAAAEAAPLTRLSEIDTLLAGEKPVDFRRISLAGEFVKPNVNNGDPFHLMMSNGKSMMWRMFQSFKNGDDYVFVAAKEFADREKATPPKAVAGEYTLNGYVRLVRPSSRFMPASNAAINEWHVFNADPATLDWSNVVTGANMPVTYYIDWVVGVTQADQLPIKKPELRNNHLDYMLTWYSFALILFVIYLILHRRAGRLQFRD